MGRLALHLHGLLERGMKGQWNRNHLADSIKTICRLIYEVGVHICRVIQRGEGRRFTEDGISFVAMHAHRRALGGAGSAFAWRHTPASPTRSSATHHSPLSRLSGAPPPKPITSEPLPASSPSWAIVL
ncbi:PRD domain-containing protein [Streptomyces sp. NPDC003832]